MAQEKQSIWMLLCGELGRMQMVILKELIYFSY
jgi:hypothetical protein